MALRAVFLSEVHDELTRHPPRPARVFDEAGTRHLPTPVRRFLDVTGWRGRPVPTNARLRWTDVTFRRGPDEDWMDLHCEQLNAAIDPTRLVYMTTRVLGGMVAFAGRDKLQRGQGSMRITLGGVLLGDTHDAAMDVSAHVTWLAELPFLPSVALASGVTWEAIDDRRAFARWDTPAATVTGTFHFDGDGHVTRFETDDRFYSDGANTRRVPWEVRCGDWHAHPSVHLPRWAEARWRLPEGDLPYFRGGIEAVEYDVTSFPIPS